MEEVLRSRRNIGEIADESDDEDDIEQADDMADLDIDDWNPDKLEWIDFESSIDTGNARTNNVPNKRLIPETVFCAVLGTLRSRFCVF